MLSPQRLGVRQVCVSDGATYPGGASVALTATFREKPYFSERTEANIGTRLLEYKLALVLCVDGVGQCSTNHVFRRNSDPDLAILPLTGPDWPLGRHLYSRSVKDRLENATNRIKCPTDEYQH